MYRLHHTFRLGGMLPPSNFLHNMEAFAECLVKNGVIQLLGWGELTFLQENGMICYYNNEHSYRWNHAWFFITQVPCIHLLTCRQVSTYCITKNQNFVIMVVSIKMVQKGMEKWMEKLCIEYIYFSQIFHTTFSAVQCENLSQPYMINQIVYFVNYNIHLWKALKCVEVVKFCQFNEIDVLNLTTYVLTWNAT